MQELKSPQPTDHLLNQQGTEQKAHRQGSLFQDSSPSPSRFADIGFAAFILFFVSTVTFTALQLFAR